MIPTILIAAASAIAHVRALILRRRLAILASTRVFPCVDWTRQARADRRIAGSGHATHTRAMDLAASYAQPSSDSVSIETKWKPTPPARPPAARSLALGSAPRDTSPSSCLRDSASHRR